MVWRAASRRGCRPARRSSASATVAASAWWSKKSTSRPLRPWSITSSTGAVREATIRQPVLIASISDHDSTNG
jgi:hypothetical protein